MTEVWRDVVGWEGLYEVSSCGRVRSLDREITQGSRWGGLVQRRIKGRLVGRAGRNRYPLVTLCGGGSQVSAWVHQLVCSAFHGPRPAGHEVAHTDGDPSNCSADNLRWATPRENRADSLTHGTLARGERHGEAKLTNEAVRTIRRSKEPLSALTQRFNVSPATISMIRTRKIWRSVPDE